MPCSHICFHEQLQFVTNDANTKFKEEIPKITELNKVVAWYQQLGLFA